MIRHLADAEDIRPKICLERVVFKLLENNLQKTRFILNLFQDLCRPLKDFDLSQFGTDEEI